MSIKRVTLKIGTNQSLEQSKHLHIYSWQNSRQTEIIKFANGTKYIYESQSMH